MRKIFKNISLLFLLIAGLVVLSHSFIPHDHHYDLADDLADRHHNDAENEPLHCHFLDFAMVNGSVQKAVNQKVVMQPVFFSVLSLPFDKKESFRPAYLIKSDFKPVLFIFVSSSPVRGSPLV